MPGPSKQFDADNVISLAMGLFDRNGYEKTSISDLLAVMKIHRSSFYATFGSKRGLFIRTLSAYRFKILTTISAALLDASDDYIANIQNWLDVLLDALHSGRAVELGANAFLEIAERDTEVRKLANEFFFDLENIVEKALELSGRDIQIGQLNHKHLASLIALQVQSTLLLYKSGAPLSMIDNSVTLIKELLEARHITNRN
ncbi:TetR/AcrR family transcriptional regulator [Zhongshania sp.]|uniref:TetR/AcrR family transcriptional regulator n=1 Tax=Zhongshania sp. TaxID=1971902 RepID=UPI003568D53A